MGITETDGMAPQQKFPYVTNVTVMLIEFLQFCR